VESGLTGRADLVVLWYSLIYNGLTRNSPVPFLNVAQTKVSCILESMCKIPYLHRVLLSSYVAYMRKYSIAIVKNIDPKILMDLHVFSLLSANNPKAKYKFSL
jgi:hypothetical protein